MDVEGVIVNHAIAGSGPPLLLLHGYPENHLMWRHVAPVLAEDHTVVLADLRGYGDSGKPTPDAAGLVYAKRSMARDQAGLMRQLGFAQFAGPSRCRDQPPQSPQQPALQAFIRRLQDVRGRELYGKRNRRPGQRRGDHRPQALLLGRFAVQPGGALADQGV
jgi:hypothetical protein